VSASKQPVKFNCPCGSSSTEVVGRYAVVRCRCGKFQWTLQPRRGGPLRFFPWPGPNLTRAELAEQEMSQGNDHQRNET
jgi:hypothetical protein